MNARPAFRGARVPRNGRAIEAGRGASRRALGAVLALAALVLSLAPGAAVAAPEAKILRIDPRAAQTEGAPILTTLIDLSQTKKADEVTRTCNALSGDARFDCVSAELDKPGAVYSSFDFPERNALFTVDIDRQDFPATFESKARWGDKLGQPLIGTAWVIMVDAAATMGPRFDEAKAVASAFINALGPQDIVIVKLFNDRGVVQDSGWTNQKQKAQGTLDAVATTYKGGRARALGTIIQNGVTDSFKELGNVGVNVQIPLHQAVVVLSNGTAGADATSTANHALLMRKYMNGGRFPEDNTALPKTPVPLISIWFPNKEYEEFYETAQGFMENLANTEAGGYFNIVRDRQAQRQALIDANGAAEPDQYLVNQLRIIDRSAERQRDEHGDRLPAHDVGEHLRPFGAARFKRQTIVGQRFVGAAGQRLGRTAEHAVDEAQQQQRDAATHRRDQQRQHFEHHAGGRGDNQRPPPDAVGERARRHFGADDDQRPDEVEQRIFGRRQPQVEKQHSEYRIVEARVEKHAKGDEALAVGLGRAVREGH